MNDWDLMFKSADLYGPDEEPEEEPFELPEGYEAAEVPGDDYGFYGTDAAGRLVLVGTKKLDGRAEYAVAPGCAVIAPEAFADQAFLEKVQVPATVEEIGEGAFSNSGGWASDAAGIAFVSVDPGNRRYGSDECCLYEKRQDGRRKLLLYYAAPGETAAVIKKEIAAIGAKAFFGKKITRVVFEENGCAYTFPKHAYFREELLKSFGRNGKLYDFTEYDSFVLRSHFNPERIRMLCERLLQPWELSDEMRERMVRHIRADLSKTLEGLTRENAIGELQLMTQAGLFDEENISEAVEILNRSDCREMMTYLMDYKMRNFGADEFDFSV